MPCSAGEICGKNQQKANEKRCSVSLKTSNFSQRIKTLYRHLWIHESKGLQTLNIHCKTRFKPRLTISRLKMCDLNEVTEKHLI